MCTEWLLLSCLGRRSCCLVLLIRKSTVTYSLFFVFLVGDILHFSDWGKGGYLCFHQLFLLLPFPCPHSPSQPPSLTGNLSELKDGKVVGVQYVHRKWTDFELSRGIEMFKSQTRPGSIAHEALLFEIWVIPETACLCCPWSPSVKLNVWNQVQSDIFQRQAFEPGQVFAASTLLVRKLLFVLS